jgi:hypothetical protein
MPAGLKQSSSVVPIGFAVTETANNTFTQASVDLNLSPLDREVFVVLAINLDVSAPDCVAATDTRSRGALTSTSQTAIPTLQDANCLSRITLEIAADAGGALAVPFSSQALETPPSTLDYIGIIATNDFFVQVEGTGNTTTKGLSGKIYGYRAVADASIYAALVQSEVLSA